MPAKPQTVRPAAVAGQFYAGDAAQLTTNVRGFLKEAEEVAASEGGEPHTPKALIVPHAGLVYSGAIAARAYARLAPIAGTIKRVVMFGPAHRVYVDGMGVPSVEAFETPLGTISLDRNAIDELLSLPFVETSDAAHAEEHSLEVQLPFLQEVLEDFELVPVVVGGANGEQVAEAIKLLWGGPETLIVISSDLSHYHQYAEAQQLDGATSVAIMNLQTGKLRPEDACGARPVNGLLRVAVEKELTPKVLDLRNSGDTASGPKDKVVGYGAWSFSESPDTTQATLSQQEKGQLLRVAAGALQHSTQGNQVPRVHVGSFPASLRYPGASFVTYTKNGNLRGCIGSLQAYRPLVADVVAQGYAAARSDQRFKPIQAGELVGLHVEVAVLSAAAPMSFEDEEDLLGQLKPGADGLILQDRNARATFLPKVWEQIGEPRQFLGQLKQKAGLPATHWSDTMRISRYTTDAFGTHLKAGQGNAQQP